MRNCAILGFTDQDHWRPGIGDPTIAGWVTVAAYFIAAFLCWKSGCAGKSRGSSLEASFWFLLTCLLLFLGMNKQLDLQTWFTLFGKHLAQEEGWYGQRRLVQAIFISLVGLIGCISLFIFWRFARPKVRHYRLALFGAVSLTAFILIRAASFHYVDKMLGVRLNHLRLNFILELGGIACVGLAAFRNWRELVRTSTQCSPQTKPDLVPKRTAR